VADFRESRSAKLSRTRHEFQKMVELIDRGGAKAILTWHPDRLSRNLGDVDALIRVMEITRLIRTSSACGLHRLPALHGATIIRLPERRMEK
jgi:DNA invertase Pin-like site-specific DNA recombinase